MSWKYTLYDYVQDKNQASVECCESEPPAFIDDVSYLARERARRAGERILAEERALLPQSGETKLKINEIRQLREAFVADITMHRKRTYRVRGGEYTEERLEKERLTIRYYENRWRITSVEHLNAEGIVSTDNGLTLRASSPSLPFFNDSILRKRPTVRKRVAYDRQATVNYANRWWDSNNPAYLAFKDNCTNFASQCLFAGGGPMNYTGKRELGWWYVGMDHHQELWSFSWAVAHALQTYAVRSATGLHGKAVSSPQELELGDMISYDWNGDGRFQHNAIVTAKDGMGMPLVNAHTTNSKQRYWSYRDSYAWTANTKYVFVKMDNEMIKDG